MTAWSESDSSLSGFSHHKFFALFIYLLFSLIVYPYVRENTFGYFVFRVIGGVGIVFTVYVISLRRTLLIVALLLAIPAITQRVVFLQARAGWLPSLNTLLSFAFDIFVVVVIFRRVFSNRRPDSETIFGALCIYLLIGFGFASLYAMVAATEPRAFYLDPTLSLRATPDRFDFVYFSFCSMTTLGASGIAAVSDKARSLSIIQAIIGLLYLAVSIARLLGAYRHPSEHPVD